jgi:hypothetical protein
MKTFECTIELGCTNPVREAETVEEFVENLVDEYNGICGEFFTITSSMIQNIEEVG